MTCSCALAYKGQQKSVLDTILLNKKREVETLKQTQASKSWQKRAFSAPLCRDFLKALQQKPGQAFVAEIKKKAPAKGVLKNKLNITKQAKAYEKAGAAAISVLTDECFFDGSLNDLIKAKAAVEIPILRKDFIIDPIQLYQAKLAGADAILLIVKALSPDSLKNLYEITGDLGMTALIEINDEKELDTALSLNPSLIGINNGNLSNLEICLETSSRLRPLVPKDVCLLSASGIQGPEDVRKLAQKGMEAFLVGSSLMAAHDPKEALLKMTYAAKEIADERKA